MYHLELIIKLNYQSKINQYDIQRLVPCLSIRILWWTYTNLKKCFFYLIKNLKTYFTKNLVLWVKNIGFLLLKWELIIMPKICFGVFLLASFYWIDLRNLGNFFAESCLNQRKFPQKIMKSSWIIFKLWFIQIFLTLNSIDCKEDIVRFFFQIFMGFFYLNLKINN